MVNALQYTIYADLIIYTIVKYYTQSIFKLDTFNYSLHAFFLLFPNYLWFINNNIIWNVFIENLSLSS